MRTSFVFNILRTCAALAWWLAPLAAFWIGYFLVWSTFRGHRVITPDLHGLSLADAVCNAGYCGCSIRIVSTNIIPGGREMVIGQQPRPGAKMKPGGVISLSVSRPSAGIVVPDFYKMPLQEIEEWAASVGCKLKVVTTTSLLPQGVCLAHDPATLELMQPGDTLHVVTSSGSSPLRSTPALKGMTREKAQLILAEYALPVEWFGSQDGDAVIVEQRPLAGAIMHVGKQTMALYAQERGGLFEERGSLSYNE